MKKVLESQVKIRFHDCDPYNHLNNARYIDYILTARGDQLLDNYGLDIYQLASEQGLVWLTAQNQIAYLSPARTMEEVTIQTQLTGFSSKTLQLEALMWNRDKTQLKAVLWTRFVHFDLQKKSSQSHSESLLQLFSSVVNPLVPATDFETRIKTLAS